MATEKELMQFFDDLITHGRLSREVEIGTLKVTMQTLTEVETIDAEGVFVSTVGSVPFDTIERQRRINRLASAITAINGKDLYADTKEEDKPAVRNALRTTLGKLSPAWVDYLDREYRRLALQQQETVNQFDEDHVRNF